MKRIIFLAIFLAITIAAFTCDMAAMISEAGYNIAWRDSTSAASYDEQYDLIQFLENQSTTGGNNQDGYGLAYYKHEAVFGDTIYAFDDDSDVNYDNTPDPMDTMHDVVISDANDVAIVMGHLRNGTGGTGSHPFVLQLEDDEHVYTFMHNGGIVSEDEDEDIWSFLNNNDWFDDGYESNWYGTDQDESLWIDSELLFHYIMYFIRETGYISGLGYDTFGGIRAALNATLPGYSSPIYEHFQGDEVNNILNFILSDGENLYVYRNSLLTDDDHDLRYKTNSTSHNYMISTQDYLTFQVLRDHLMIFTPHGFYDEDIDDWDEDYVSGTISVEHESWAQSKRVMGRLYIPYGDTLSIDASSVCYIPSTILVRGVLEISSDRIFRLNDYSEIIVDSSGAELYFEFNSSLDGNKAGFYFETAPNQNPGGEAYIHGDRIVIENGGKINTQTYTSTTPPYNAITICSNSAERWDGIHFNDINATQIMRNFEISEINAISFNGCGENRAYAHFIDVVIDDIGSFTADTSIPVKIYADESAGCSLSNFDNPISDEIAKTIVHKYA